jgi:hypothetical protein
MLKKLKNKANIWNRADFFLNISEYQYKLIFVVEFLILVEELGIKCDVSLRKPSTLLLTCVRTAHTPSHPVRCRIGFSDGVHIFPVDAIWIHQCQMRSSFPGFTQSDDPTCHGPRAAALILPKWTALGKAFLASLCVFPVSVLS